jgi:hypothetical protein
MVAFNLGLGWIGSPRSRIAAIRQAAMSRAPRSRSSGMSVSVGEQKANSQTSTAEVFGGRSISEAIMEELPTNQTVEGESSIR